jgi:predicted TIM-barrel fold metal-dependent hydrolase
MLNGSAPDFSDVLFIDHHCHPYESANDTLDGESLAKAFFHGMGDIPDPEALKARHWGTTRELRYHFPHMGVVNTLVCQLSRVFNCPAELEAVARERNSRTRQGFAAYAKFLYDDAKIAATVVDTGLPDNDPALELIPGKKLRLFKLEPIFQELLQKSDSYSQLVNGYLESLDRAVSRQGYIGVKAHLAEQVGFGIEPVWQSEAEAAFAAAKKGSADARKKLYVAIFTATMRQCQELGVPLHLHSGFTGGLWDGPLHNADPFLLAPLLKQHEFLTTKIVLLHAG